MPESALSGFASSEGTSRFRDRFPTLASDFNRLGRTDLLCSPVGFGTYRCDVRVAEHKAALVKAIRMGVNLIDTSANYADGNAERMIGEVLGLMVGSGEIKRDEIIIVSKGGYIQGENYQRIAKLAEDKAAGLTPGAELNEIVRYSKGLWHSIHPDFLKDQIDRSLQRMNLETIDAYLLHNPEYYIQWAIKDGIPEDEAREIYEARIQKAFSYLEQEVTNGRIKWYGISSNTFGKPEDAVDRTALEKIWMAADAKTKGSNHFAVIQLPLNLYEPGGLLEKNQEKSTKSVIEFAREKDLGVLINRPLNAFGKNMLIRLADYPEREFPPVEEITDLVHDLKLQEEEFKNGPLKDVALNPQAYDAVKKLLSVGEWLDGKWQHLPSFEEWRDLLYTVIKPRMQYAFDLLQGIALSDPGVFKQLQDYAESIDETMEHITNYYLTMAHERSLAIHKVVDEVLPAEDHEISLSQKAILMLRSIEGVSSVLVGMRSDEYVEDVIFGLQARKLENAEVAWKRLEL
ncbi:MAG: aldo/keto reductase [Bacteroidota bacterium]|nr:aldo/keto reductase [Bacteroidota bacterium]